MTTSFKKKGWTFSQTPIWATCDPNLSDGTHRLFVYLAWRQGNDNTCWPSISTIAHDLGTSPSTIRRRLRELEEAGYLTTNRRKGRSNIYTLIADPGGASRHTPTPRKSAGGHGSQPPSNLKGTPVKSDGRPPSNLKGAPVKSEGGPPSNLEGTPVKSEGGPLSNLKGTPVKSDTHDDKKEQETKTEEKEDNTMAILWPSILKNLSLQLTQNTFETWLANATARQEGKRWIIQLPSRAAVEWVSQRLNRIVTRTVRRITQDASLSVAYEVQP